jgi:glycosyltransferase involved in cell wall biosynthesis
MRRNDYYTCENDFNRAKMVLIFSLHLSFMRILILNYEYPPLGAGAGVITSHIAEGLAHRQNDVTVLTTWFNGEKEYAEAIEGNLKIIRLKSKRKFTYRSNVWEMLSWIRHSKEYLSHYLKENPFDIVFANFALPGGAVAAFIKRQFGIPYVIISHGHDIPWFFPKQMFFYHLLTYHKIKSICNDSSALFVQSPDMFRNAQRFLGKAMVKNIHLIHNGTDYHAFFPDGSARGTGFRILFAGRLVRQKGPFIFLDALKKLKSKGIPFETVIIGDGPLRSGMESYVRKNNLTPVIKFTGWIDKAAIIKEYRTAHVMVAPSLNEGMSMALMEALASGLYVFTTPVSCNEQMISQGINGELFPTRNSAALSDRLASYYHDKFIKDYRVPESSTKEFHHLYDWEYIVEKYEQVLKGICG